MSAYRRNCVVEHVNCQSRTCKSLAELQVGIISSFEHQDPNLMQGFGLLCSFHVRKLVGLD